MKTAQKLDPSRTTTLRQRLTAELYRALQRVKSRVYGMLVGANALHLDDGPATIVLLPDQPDDLSAFAEFLDDTFEQVLIDQIPHFADSLEQAYQKGVARSYFEARKGIDPALIPGGTAEFIRRIMTEPLEALTVNELQRDWKGRFISPKVKLLASRLETELRGMTAATSQAMARVLADGITKGHKASTVARAINKQVDTVGKRRASLIARSEIVRAHAEGQLDAAEKLELTVKVNAEWDTANDDRVCPQCSEMAGQELTVEEARGLIPIHAGCRCSWSIVSEEKVVKRGVPTTQSLRRRL